MNENYNPDNVEPEIPEQEEPEVIGFSDIFIGVFTAPKQTYAAIAKTELKTTYWLFPVLLLILSVIISSTIMTTNPDIRSYTKEKARTAMETRMAEMVKQGKMTKTDAETFMAKNEEQLNAIGTGKALIFQSIGIIVVTFLFFFVVAGYFYFISQFFLGAEFSYKHSLVAYAPMLYIGILEVIIVLVVSLLTGKTSDISVAGLVGYESKDILRFILSKLNIFSIWSYAVLAIGLAQLAKAASEKKYYFMVFGSWLAWSLIWFGITKIVPFFDMYT